MPIHVRPISRRSFLSRTAAAAAFVPGLAAWAKKSGGHPADPNCFALLSDTHVPSDPNKSSRGVNMTENFRKAAGQVTGLKPPPAGAIICGDLAYLKGLETDYKQLAPIVKTLPGAKVPAHLVLGNHDNRKKFYAVLKKHKPAVRLVSEKHVSILESPYANWFLLDSLEKVNSTPGKLGKKQLSWLAKALDARKDKPAIVMAHHDLHLTPEGGKPQNLVGLKDTRALMKVLMPRKHVKAYINGHRHFWKHSVYRGLCLIGLPAAAYVFNKSQTSAWVLAHLRKDGMNLEMRCLDSNHPLHGDKVRLTWR